MPTRILSRAAAARCRAGAAHAGLARMAAIPIQHWTQPSGAKVYLVESPAIPMVDVQIDFDAGSRRDPPAQAGLAGVTAGMVDKGIAGRNGASPRWTRTQLGEAWADLGAGFDAGAGTDRMSFSLRSLTDPDAAATRRCAWRRAQIGEPAFPDDVWQRERAAHGRVDPRSQHPARPPWPAAPSRRPCTAAIPMATTRPKRRWRASTCADMQPAATRSSSQPCRAKVSIVGAVTRAQADTHGGRRCCRACPPHGGCAAAAARGARSPPLAARRPSAHAFRLGAGPCADRPARLPAQRPGPLRADSGQLHPGRRRLRFAPDEEVREKRGLSYSVYSYFSPGLHAGAFTHRPADPARPGGRRR